jgi:spore maturation protein CgeB
VKVVIFGLTVTSSWGNGHATLWRGLARALAQRGHSVVFFERDVPYYASERDLWILPGCWLHLYRDWSECLPVAIRESANADVAMVTSFCPDGASACDVVLSSSAKVRVFYDMDTPVTLEKVRQGEPVFYLPRQGLSDFDLVLSYTGGAPVEKELKNRLGARRVAPLYGSVDPDAHFPVPAVEGYRCDLSYLGTYAQDRQPGVESLLLEPARQKPDQRFIIAGAMYPSDLGQSANVQILPSLPPPEHPKFYCSSRLTLNVTRKAMATMGYCPSGRFFEAAACGTPLLSDWWNGLDQFYEPGQEILIARNTSDALDALSLSDAELSRIGRAARERTLSEHTAEQRAIEFEQAAQDALNDSGSAATALAG